MEKNSLLIVDEDAYFAGIFANRFETAGWKVRIADTVEEAKKQLAKKIPNAILLDPAGIDESLEFLHTLRMDTKTTGCVITILTELGDRELVQKAESAGADGYFFKGHFFPSEALKKLQRLVKEREHS